MKTDITGTEIYQGYHEMKLKFFLHLHNQTLKPTENDYTISFSNMEYILCLVYTHVGMLHALF